MKALELNNKKLTLIMIITLTIVGVIFISYSYYSNLNKPVNLEDNQDIYVTIPKGTSTSKIAAILKEKNLIKNEFYFRYTAKSKNLGSSFQAGEYKMNRTMYQDEIMTKLVSGDVYIETVKLTIPEGFELRQIIDRLSSIEELNLSKDKLYDLVENEDFNYKFLEEVPKGENRLEGFLFPDTYEVKKDINEKEILSLMLNRFNSVFKEEYYEKAKNLNMSINEVITLASIIEREAKVNEERPLVSSVFHNRLSQKRLLQSCATVQYILGERKENLTYADLEIESPYNTYKYLGLPPMPIASPGEASVKAALYPAETDFLYFVAKGDGTHTFTKTYNEHLNAKNGK